jgi:hypothetical protein
MANAEMHATGQIDVGFISPTGVTPWLKKLVKKAPAAIDTALVSPTGQAVLNSTGNIFAFPRKLDVLFGIRIQVTLPALVPTQINVGSTTTYAYELTARADVTTASAYADGAALKAGYDRSALAGSWVRWVNSVGHVMFTEIRFVVAGTSVTKLTSDLMNCLECTVGKQGLKGMDTIGKFENMEQAILWSSAARKLYVDVPLWFTEDVSVALILAALTLNTLTLELDTRAITDLIMVSNPDIGVSDASAAALSNTSLSFKAIFRGAQVSVSERKIYMNHGAATDVLMKDYQVQSFSSSDTAINKPIFFIGPISTVIWTTQLQGNIAAKYWFDYTLYGSGQGTYQASSYTTYGETTPALLPMTDMTGMFILSSILNSYASAALTTAGGNTQIVGAPAGVAEGSFDTSIVSPSPDVFADFTWDANSNVRHQTMSADYYRTCSYLDYGYAAPQDPIYMITFARDPFGSDYTGSMNVSKMDNLTLTGNVTTGLDSGQTVGPYVLRVHGIGRNFFTYKGGGGGKTYN